METEGRDTPRGETQAARPPSPQTATRPPFLTDQANERVKGLTARAQANPAATICLVVAGVGTLIAMTLNDAGPDTHYGKKWLLFGSLLVGIVGWVWGRGTTEARTKLGVALILGLIAAFALHAGLFDSEWQQGNVGSRLAVSALGVALITGAGLAFAKDKKAQLFVGRLIWLWLMGWWAFFLFAPTKMQLEYDVHRGYGGPVHWEFFYYIFFAIVGVAGLVWLVAAAEESGKTAHHFDPPTTVAHSKFAKLRHIFSHDITGHDDETGE
jgi:hypothetical protein